MSRIILITDGSSISANNSKGFDAAAAFVIYKGDKMIYKESILLKNHTNNYAEMYAIYKGTKYLVENELGIYDADEVLVITDSQLCQKSLTEWMKGWLKKTDNEVLKSTTGEVKNQELIKSAYINILMLELILPVSVCHINSHKPESEIPKMYEKFSSEFPDILIDEFRMIYEGNQLCDTMAYDKLNEK
jgi:ribonuclease HI